MKKIILYLLAVLFCLSLQAQQHFFGIIQDTDGYVNVRDNAKRIIGKLADNQVFFDWDAAGWKDSTEWHSIEYATEGGITKSSGEKGLTRRGRIHRSRIRYLNELPQLAEQPNSSDTCLVFANDTLAVEIRLRRFIPQRHKIVRDAEGGFIRSIDGCTTLLGIDGGMPHTEYASISVRHPGGVSEFPAQYLAYLYEPATQGVSVALGKGNTLFVSTCNSDGAGGYDAVWTGESPERGLTYSIQLENVLNTHLIAYIYLLHLGCSRFFPKRMVGKHLIIALILCLHIVDACTCKQLNVFSDSESREK